MEKFLSRYSWTLNLAALAAIAFFSAQGVGEIVASSASEMLPGDAAQTTAVAVRAHRAPRHAAARPDGTPILERNIFDSLVGPVLPGAEEEVEAQPVGDGELPLVPCPAGNLKLLSTVASSNNAAWSFATVKNGQAAELYRVGDQLDGRTVVAISWRYMLLRGTSDDCYLDLYGEEGSLTRAQPARQSGAPSDPSIASGIEVNGENERTVQRSLVDEALANPTKFARSVRVRPYTENGENKGFRLRKIEKGSPLELLGAQRGDIIHSVNGTELNSVDKALAMYQSLRNENRLTFSITRRGKPMDLVINIR
jgi:general secretion pathway protein C